MRRRLPLRSRAYTTTSAAHPSSGLELRGKPKPWHNHDTASPTPSGNPRRLPRVSKWVVDGLASESLDVDHTIA